MEIQAKHPFKNKLVLRNTSNRLKEFKNRSKRWLIYRVYSQIFPSWTFLIGTWSTAPLHVQSDWNIGYGRFIIFPKVLDLGFCSVVVFRRIGVLVVNRVSVFGRLVVVLKHGFQTKVLYSPVHITRDLLLVFPSSRSQESWVRTNLSVPRKSARTYCG